MSKEINNTKKTTLSLEQRQAIDEALNSIEQNGTRSHMEIMEQTKLKFPYLFKY